MLKESETMKIETHCELPEKLSDLIILALGDLEKAEKSDEYIVDMIHWHNPLGANPTSVRQTCQVCLAGSLMAMTLGAPKDRHLTPSDFLSQEVQNKLLALNFARMGLVNGALDILGKPTYWQLGPPSRIGIAVSWYDGGSPDDFKCDMRYIVERLVSVGE